MEERAHPSRAPGRPAAAAAGLALALVVLLGLGACGRERGRVLLIGIDGASPRVMDGLMARGELPNLAHIAEVGVYGPLRSIPPYLSPRVWNTIATGKTPRKHGILSFARQGEDGKQHLYRSSDRKAHALWNIADEAGLRVAVINWWTTYPPPRVDGVVVSDHAVEGEIHRRRKMTKAVEEPLSPLVHPEAWEERALELLASDEPLTGFRDFFAGADGFPRWVNLDTLSWVYRTDRGAVRTALAAFEEFDPQLAMVFLPGIDRVSHWLWQGIEPQEKYPERIRLTEEQKRVEAEALQGYYRYTDALIGLLAERFGPDDLVMVVSDHGFEAGVEMGFLTGTHESREAGNGVLFARGPDVRNAGLDGEVTVKDVTPAVLAWLGLPVARDMDGRAPPFLRVARRERVETYDTAPIERAGGEASGSEQEILERLRRLGYLEE